MSRPLYLYIWSAVLLFSIWGCGPAAESSDLSTPNYEEEVRETATAYFNTFSERKDWDKLLSFYPELPTSFENITISHLLSHRSGLLDYIDDNTNVLALDNLNMRDALAFISDPNSGFEYMF